MRKTCHYCWSSDEIIFRDNEDYIRGINAFGLAAHLTESCEMALSVMSTHLHSCLQTANIKDLSHEFRLCYSRYFNKKYHRKGRLGEMRPFVTELNGYKRILNASDYVISNAVHHGVAETPFEYPYNSSNAIFRSELGKRETETLLPDSQVYKFLPERKALPPGWRMTSSGLIRMTDLIDVSFMEGFYISPKNYTYHMGRRSYERIVQEQHEESETIPLITLDVIEKGVSDYDSVSARNNISRSFDRNRVSDIELCRIIDKELVPSLKYESIYDVPESQRRNMGNILWKGLTKNRVSEAQLRRCLLL